MSEGALYHSWGNCLYPLSPLQVVPESDPSPTRLECGPTELRFGPDRTYGDLCPTSRYPCAGVNRFSSTGDLSFTGGTVSSSTTRWYYVVIKISHTSFRGGINPMQSSKFGLIDWPFRPVRRGPGLCLDVLLIDSLRSCLGSLFTLKRG